MTYVESEQLVGEKQSGYKVGHRTKTVLLKLTDDKELNKDKKLLTAMAMFDSSSSFDSVCHAILLTKLRT